MNTSNLIYKKMVEVMRDIGPVSKDQKNTAQGYKFRGIDQFINALHPVLVKHGVLMTPAVVGRQENLKDVTRSNGKEGVDKHVSLVVNFTFYAAEDGSSVVVTMPGEGIDSGDKATNKALSAALKYALIQTFMVPTEDMAEADLESPELGREKKAASALLPDTRQTAPETSTTTTALATPTTGAKVSSFRKKKAEKTTETAPAASAAPTPSNGAKNDDWL